MSSTRALNAILPQIASSPYEAHQKARTFASRYIKSNQHAVAIDVLFQSARELLKNGQAGSGVDLTGFLLDAYEAGGVGVNEESRGRLTQLIALTGSEGAWRKTIIDKSIAWSVKHGPNPAGDPELHHYVGELLYKEGAFDSAEPHFLASGNRDSARLLAEMHVQWLTSTESDPGLFALRGTLPYLLNGNILAARTFITHFASSLPPSLRSSSAGETGKETVEVTKDSVVNFCQMAVFTCQRAHGDKNKVIRESWVRLVGTYQSKSGALASPEIRVILQEIGSLYFALPPPKNQASNPMADMISSMFGGPPGGGSGGKQAKRMLAPASSPAAAPGLD